MLVRVPRACTAVGGVVLVRVPRACTAVGGVVLLTHAFLVVVLPCFTTN